MRGKCFAALVLALLFGLAAGKPAAKDATEVSGNALQELFNRAEATEKARSAFVHRQRVAATSRERRMALASKAHDKGMMDAAMQAQRDRGAANYHVEPSPFPEPVAAEPVEVTAELMKKLTGQEDHADDQVTRIVSEPSHAAVSNEASMPLNVPTRNAFDQPPQHDQPASSNKTNPELKKSP
jgi:hypothetical protein